MGEKIWQQLVGTPARCWRLACILLILLFVPWTISVVGALFGLLIWIGVGIWRLVNRSDRGRR